MSAALLRLIPPEQVAARRGVPLDAGTLAQAAGIVEDVRVRGTAALREYAERLDGLDRSAPLVRSRAELDAALNGLAPSQAELLKRVAGRIRAFAQAQKAALTDVCVVIPGGSAGHTVLPLESAGCYAPGGRFPLPSSVLMTAVTARVAGVQRVWVASPRPTPVVLAAAAVAEADGLLAAGGAHAIAALAFGVAEVAPCDVVVGPGNRWVTAAKQIVAGRIAIDMLAGPSELVVLADETADPALVAADLLAQAEHDADALPLLVTTDPRLVPLVERELAAQLGDVPTGEVARAALRGGFATVCSTLSEAVAICEKLAPEHLELHVTDARTVARRLGRYGSLFVGPGSAEVLADYGAGPNHVLPTGGTARVQAGLSVYTFLRPRTWLRIDDVAAARPLLEDAAAMARMEGLEAHARSAERRLGSRWCWSAMPRIGDAGPG